MFKTNEGTIDRALRVIVGAALILAYFFNPDGAYSWLYWIGIIPLVTGAIGSCPLYSIFGISTCKMKK